MFANGWYKRSAGLEALHFQFTDMFVNVQFVQISHFRPHYAYTMFSAGFLHSAWFSVLAKTYSFVIFGLCGWLVRIANVYGFSVRCISERCIFRFCYLAFKKFFIHSIGHKFFCCFVLMDYLFFVSDIQFSYNEVNFII